MTGCQYPRLLSQPWIKTKAWGQEVGAVSSYACGTPKISMVAIPNIVPPTTGAIDVLARINNGVLWG